MFKQIRILLDQKQPLRFLIGYLLWKSGLCRNFIIRFPKFNLRYHKAALPRELWINRSARSTDFIFFDNYLTDNDIVVDVGANIGSLAIHASTLVKKSGQIYAFEPHPITFTHLIENIKLNNLLNVKTYNLGLGEEEGYLGFTNMESDDQNKVEENGAIKIKVSTLDKVFSSFKDEVALLKIDVEGYEPFVLRGANNFLDKVKCIYFESFESGFTRYGSSSNDVNTFLRGKGFTIFKVSSEKKLDELPPDFISYNNTNLVAIRSIDEFVSRTSGTWKVVAL